jgi:hypothetical protein
MMPCLAVETLDEIFQYLSSSDLTKLLRVDRLFYNITVRILNQKIPELPIERTLACLVSLRANNVTSPLVRHLTVNWKSISLYRRSELRSEYTELLRKCLMQLRCLNSLTLHLDDLDSTSMGRLILPDHCPSALTSFTTNLVCDQFLIHFVESQPSLVSLDLMEYPRTNPRITLDYLALPRLKSFDSQHADPQFVAEFLRNRPMERVKFSVGAHLGYDVLDTLKLSRCPIKTLSIIFRDVERSPLAYLNVSLPDLEELNICLAKMEWYKAGDLPFLTEHTLMLL